MLEWVQFGSIRSRCAWRRESPQAPLSRPPKIILQTHNVVFTEIIAALHFDEDQQLVARILDAVGRSDGDVDCLSGRDDEVAIIQSHFRGALDYDPVLFSLRVLLITQTLPRQNFNAFDFKVLAFIQDGEGSPRSSIEFCRGVGG